MANFYADLVRNRGAIIHHDYVAVLRRVKRRWIVVDRIRFASRRKALLIARDYGAAVPVSEYRAHGMKRIRRLRFSSSRRYNKT